MKKANALVVKLYTTRFLVHEDPFTVEDNVRFYGYFINLDN